MSAPELIAASSVNTLKDVMAILGGVMAIVGTLIGAYLGYRRIRDHRLRQQREDSLAMTGKFARLETAVAGLSAVSQDNLAQYRKLSDRVEATIKIMQADIDAVKTQCTRHQQSVGIEALRKDVERITTKADRIGLELIQYRESAGDKFLSVASYQSDLIMWTNNFDSLRQSIRDLNLLLTKGRVP